LPTKIKSPDSLEMEFRTDNPAGGLQMRAFLVLMVAVSLAVAADAVAWTERPDGGVLSLDRVSLKQGMVLEAGREFATLSLAGAGLSGAPGLPSVPVYRRLVEVPYGCEVAVSAELGAVETRRLGLPLVPRQEPVPKSGPTPAFRLDEKAYATDAATTELGAKLVEVAAVRGRRVAVVDISPVSYNPARNLVEHAPRMKVTVSWAGADRAKTGAMLRRYSSPPFAGRLDGVVVNPGQFRAFDGPALPIGYLVIVPDEWQANVAPLAEWRRRKGFNVFVRNLTEVGGGQANTVKAYIQDAYDNWPIPPSFVLLVGDVDKIGFFTGGGEGSPPTDLNYSLCEGSDYWPDLDLSRASVASAAQLDSFVANVVGYEQNTLTGGTSWLNKAYFIASADASNHGITEQTHLYVMNKIRPKGTVCDSLWLYYGSGTPITTAINGGRSWVTYSGHGNTDCWADPGFDVADVHDLVNTDLIPFVQTYACLSGDFTSASYPECFSESWIRNGRRGALAHIASTVNSYWTEDDTLERRVFDYMFDSTCSWIMGGFNKAKIKFYEQIGAGPTTQRYFEMYNLMGDGAVDVYSLDPKPLDCSYAPVIPVGAYPLTVTVTSTGSPVEGALVCAAAKSDTGVWAAGYTNSSGEVTLNLTTLAPDTIFVTVTGHNLAPHLGSCMALPSSGPYVMYLRSTVDDSAGGNDDHIVNPGETVNLPMWLKNWGSEQAQGVTARMRTTDPNVTLVDTLKTLGDIGAGDSAWTGANSFRFTVAASCSNGYALRFSVVVKDSRDTTWTSPLTLVVGAPRLVYAGYLADDAPPGGNGNGMIDPGESGDVIVTLRNTGLGHAYGVTATLRSADARLEVTDSLGAFGAIEPDTTGTNEADRFSVHADGSIPRETQVPCTLVVVTGGIARKLGFNIGVGVIRTVDPIPDGPRTPALYWAYDEIDSGYVERPDFNWVEIAGVGTQLTLGDDETRQVGLPASFGPFRYYGQDYTQVSICSNGWVAPGYTTADVWSNTALPAASIPQCLFINWDDIYPPDGGGVWYWHDSVNHRFIVEWDSVRYTSGTTYETQQIILYDTTTASADGNCEIVFQYLTAVSTGSATVGLQDPTAAVFIQCLYNGTYTRGASTWNPGHAIRFTTDPPSVAIAEPSAGAGLPGRLALLGSSPNPFRGATVLRYAAPREMDLSLSVFDGAGRKVAGLFRGRARPGIRTATWDGRDGQGRRVGQGVYFYRLEGDNTTLTRKAIKLD
jgi:hypothetical protein